MSELDLIETLDRYARTVEVGPVPLTHLLRAGRQARIRRRRVRLAGVTAVAAVAAVAVAAALVVPRALDRADHQAPVIDHGASHDLTRTGELLVDEARSAFQAAYPDLPRGLYAAQDGWLDQLPLPTYVDKASMLSVSYRATDDAALRLWTGRATDPSGASLEQQCTYDLAGGSDACNVLEASDGTQAMETVRQVYWRDDSGPGRPYENLSGMRGHPIGKGAAGAPGIDISAMSSWYEHTVGVVRADGSQTLVTESVRATDLSTAQSLFRLDPAAMTELVANPELAIPAPPSAGPGCETSWTLVDHGQKCTTTPTNEVTARDVATQVAGQAGPPLTSATLWVTAGTYATRGVDGCDSGRLLHLTVTGTRTLWVTADAGSGIVCRLQEPRGDYAPNMHGERLDLDGDS